MIVEFGQELESPCGGRLHDLCVACDWQDDGSASVASDDISANAAVFAVARPGRSTIAATAGAAAPTAAVAWDSVDSSAVTGTDDVFGFSRLLPRRCFPSF